MVVAAGPGTAPGYSDLPSKGVAGNTRRVIRELRDRRYIITIPLVIAAGAALGSTGRIFTMPVKPAVGKYLRVHRVGQSLGVIPTTTGSITIDVNKNGTSIMLAAPALANREDTATIEAIEKTTDDGATYADYTAEGTDDNDGTDVTLGALSTVANGDWVTVGLKVRRNALNINMDAALVNANASVLAVHYWNGSAWVAVTGLVDGTDAAGATLAVDGTVSWLPVPDEDWPLADPPDADLNETAQAYWLRLSVSAALTADTAINDIDTERLNREVVWFECDYSNNLNRFALDDVLSIDVDEADANAANPVFLLEVSEEGETDD